MQTVLIGMQDEFWERDWLQYLFGDVLLEGAEPGKCDFEKESVIVLSDSDGRQASAVRELLAIFCSRRTPICLVHLSDEYCGCPIDFYQQAGFVIRNYYRPQAAKLPHCLHVPLGYKSGFCDQLVKRPIGGRQNSWFFAGEIKGHRREMLDAAGRIVGGRALGTSRWDDPAGLDTAAYADALADSVYAPCPRGNDSVDCFRIWEALEAGAIPIVEDDGRFESALRMARIPESVRSLRLRDRGRIRYRAAFGPSYWLGMFGETFPLPRVYQWNRLPALIAASDPEQLSNRVCQWWDGVKQKAKDGIKQGLASMTVGAEAVR